VGLLLFILSVAILPVTFLPKYVPSLPQYTYFILPLLYGAMIYVIETLLNKKHARR
jgi:hypothetical protein